MRGLCFQLRNQQKCTSYNLEWIRGGHVWICVLLMRHLRFVGVTLPYILYLVSYGVLCHYSIFFQWHFLRISLQVLSWMIVIWMKAMPTKILIKKWYTVIWNVGNRSWLCDKRVLVVKEFNVMEIYADEGHGSGSLKRVMIVRQPMLWTWIERIFPLRFYYNFNTSK